MDSPENDPDRDLLLHFLADSKESFAQGRPGSFWPRNHHRLGPLETKAASLLSAQEYGDYLFHFMRATGSIPMVKEKDLPLLIAAWRRMLPYLDNPDIERTPRHVMLFVFGFDDSGALPDGELASVKDLKARMKLVGQIDAYTHQPGQRAKKPRFAAFADAAPRILQTLRHLGYTHDRRYREKLYDYTNLSFWGMVFIALLNPRTRAEILDDMLGERYALMRQAEQLAILNRYVEAVVPDASPDEIRFLDLAAGLRERERQRRDATESVALVRRLGLSFPDDADWAIVITLVLRGMTEAPMVADQTVRLTILPDPDWQWDLVAWLKPRGRYSESSGRVLQNDPDLPGLGQGNLHAFPQWLSRLRTEHGLDFDLATAHFHVGRYRGAVKRLASWLAEDLVLMA